MQHRTKSRIRKKIGGDNPKNPSNLSKSRIRKKIGGDNPKNPSNLSNPFVTRFPIKCCSVLYFFVIVLAAYIGILNSASGRHFLLSAEASHRADLISVPLSARGMIWKIRNQLDALFVQLPLFAAGYGGDRCKY